MNPSIVSRWRRPSDEVLHEKVFPSGKPPFDPFPTVTEVTNAFFCPLAVYYDLWYNIEHALETDPFKTVYGAGEIFQNFIAHLKSRIIQGEQLPEGRFSLYWIRNKFEDFTKQNKDSDKIWEFYVEPWANRKNAELSRIQTDSNIYFEVSIAASYVRFHSPKGSRSYPLYGRIDEVDIDNKLLIERTIKRGNNVEPPKLKDFQIWLLWKALCSIEKSKYPYQWKNIDFKDFELIVETPFKDYVVDKTQDDFENLTHDAYAYIHDLTHEQKGVQEAHEGRSCTFENKESNCALLNICYFSKPEFPSSRNEMRREFKRWCRALLHEIMWIRDLRLYQFTMIDENELEKIGRLIKGKITDQPKLNQIEVEIPKWQIGPINTMSSDQLNELIVIPFGSLELGIRVGAKTSEQETSAEKIILNLTRTVPLSNRALIFTEDFLMFQEDPVFLSRYLQRDLFWLERSGKKRVEEAKKISSIQLLEGIFGKKIIKRGGDEIIE